MLRYVGCVVRLHDKLTALSEASDIEIHRTDTCNHHKKTRKLAVLHHPTPIAFGVQGTLIHTTLCTLWSRACHTPSCDGCAPKVRQLPGPASCQGEVSSSSEQHAIHSVLYYSTPCSSVRRRLLFAGWRIDRRSGGHPDCTAASTGPGISSSNILNWSSDSANASQLFIFHDI